MDNNLCHCGTLFGDCDCKMFKFESCSRCNNRNIHHESYQYKTLGSIYDYDDEDDEDDIPFIVRMGFAMNQSDGL